MKNEKQVEPDGKRLQVNGTGGGQLRRLHPVPIGQPTMEALP